MKLAKSFYCTLVFIFALATPGTAKTIDRLFHSPGVLAEESPRNNNGQYDGLRKFYDRNGRLTRTIEYKSGDSDGEEKLFDDQGRIQQTIQWEEGRKDGISTLFFDDCSVQLTETYKAGVLWGSYREFHKPKALKEEGNRIRGRLTGVPKKYTETGTLIFEALLEDDGIDPNGYQKTWTYSGTKEEEKKYSKGKLVSLRKWHPNGELSLDETYAADELIRKNTFHENGKPFESILFKDGKKNGDYSRYSDSGQIEESGVYKDGVLDGEAVQFFADGKPRVVRQYNGGEKSGLEAERYQSGQARALTMWKEDKLDGKAEFFFESGKPLCKVTYASNKRNGPMKCFYQNGNLRFDAVYSDGQIQSIKWFSEEGKPIHEIKSQAEWDTYVP